MQNDNINLALTGCGDNGTRMFACLIPRCLGMSHLKNAWHSIFAVEIIDDSGVYETKATQTMKYPRSVIEFCFMSLFLSTQAPAI